MKKIGFIGFITLSLAVCTQLLAQTRSDKPQWFGVWQAKNSRGEPVDLTVPYVAKKQMPFSLADKNGGNTLRGVAVYADTSAKASYRMVEDNPRSIIMTAIEPTTTKDCGLDFVHHGSTIEIQPTASNQDCPYWAEPLTFRQNATESDNIKPQLNDYAEVAYQGSIGDFPVYVVLGAKKSWYMYEKYKEAIDLTQDKSNAAIYHETYYDKKTDSRQRGGKFVFAHAVEVSNAPQTLRGNWQLRDKNLPVDLQKSYPLPKQQQQTIRLPMTCDKFYYTATIDYQPNRVEQHLQRINIVQKSDNTTLKSLNDALIYRSGSDVFVGDYAEGFLSKDCETITALHQDTGYAVRYQFNQQKQQYQKDFPYAYMMDKLTDANQIAWRDWLNDRENSNQGTAVYADGDTGTFFELTEPEAASNAASDSESGHSQDKSKYFTLHTGVSYTGVTLGYRLDGRMGFLASYYGAYYRGELSSQVSFDEKNHLLTRISKHLSNSEPSPYQYIKIWDTQSQTLLQKKAVLNYSKSAYQLSADGKTLLKWTGSEGLVDLHAKPFAKVNRIADGAFVDAVLLNTLILNKNFKTAPNKKRIGLDSPDATIDFVFNDY